MDPTDQTEDLGNDHIKAGDYGISNLKILMQNLETWNMERGERYDEMENMYREIVNQYTRYLRHVMPYIGGIRYEEIRTARKPPNTISTATGSVKPCFGCWNKPVPTTSG